MHNTTVLPIFKLAIKQLNIHTFTPQMFILGVSVNPILRGTIVGASAATLMPNANILTITTLNIVDIN